MGRLLKYKQYNKEILSILKVLFTRKDQRMLEFLELWQNNKLVRGLVDTGAEVNCIGGDILQLLDYEWILQRNTKVEGIGGMAETEGSVRIEFMLGTMDLVIQNFIVVKELRMGIILGLPFLRGIEAKIDCINGWLDTRYGRIELQTGVSSKVLPKVGVFTERTDRGEVELLSGDEKAMEILIKEKLQKTNLPVEQVIRIEELLVRFRSVWGNDQRGVTTHTKHEILLSTKKPLVTRPRRFTEEQQRIILDELQAMENDQIIEKSSSPYASNIVLVKKLAGTWRVCIDFRLINSYTIDDKYPLPPIQDLIRMVRNSCYFITLDLRSGYWQILMANNSKEKTAFRTPRGLYQFKVMPFGLKNAPATFQRMMDEILGDLYWKGVLAYIDDILIHGITIEEVWHNLSIVLQRLKDANLTINIDKCEFFPETIKYLGYIIGQGKIQPNPNKIIALRAAKTPTNVSEVRSLLGLLGFYRQFIQNYSSKAEPLTRLTKKGQPFIWTREQEQAMQELMLNLEEMVLANPELNEEFMLETDASNIGIGAILSCSSDGISWRPVEFMSKKLTETQQRWPVHEREAWAIVAALEKFDCYLRGRKFRVFSDNSSLQWMATSTKGKIARWATRMAEYDMEIFHRNGTTMGHVDFLSRYVDDNEYGLKDRMTVWSLSTDSTVLPTLAEIQQIQQQQPPVWGKGFAHRDGIIFYRGKVYIPPTIRKRILQICHTLNPIVHPGMRKTKSIIIKVFRWPNMDADITTYVQGCLVCQRIRPGIEKLQGIISCHDLQGAFEKVYMDIWSIQYGKKQHHCLTMIDSLTRWPEVCEIQNETATEVAQAAFCSWVSRYGVPNIIVTDRGPAFTSELFNKWCTTLGIQQIRTTPYHPEGNALIESFHRNINRAIARHSILGIPVLEFSELIALTLMGYRSTIHEQLEDSPGFLTHGVDLRPAQLKDWRFLPVAEERNRIRNLMLTRLELMSKCHERSQQIGKYGRYNNKILQIGDLVLLRIHKSEVPAVSMYDGSYKIRPKWSLPYRIIYISPTGQTATVRNLITFKSRQIEFRDTHIHNLRIISPPQDESQRKMWEQIITKEQFSDTHDPKVQREWFTKFWAKISEPVEEYHKRRRLYKLTTVGELDVLGVSG